MKIDSFENGADTSTKADSIQDKSVISSMVVTDKDDDFNSKMSET